MDNAGNLCPEIAPLGKEPPQDFAEALFGAVRLKAIGLLTEQTHRGGRTTPAVSDNRQYKLFREILYAVYNHALFVVQDELIAEEIADEVLIGVWPQWVVCSGKPKQLRAASFKAAKAATEQWLRGDVDNSERRPGRRSAFPTSEAPGERHQVGKNSHDKATRSPPQREEHLGHATSHHY